MVFSSFLFLFRFLPIVLILYFIAPRKCKNGILLVTSLIFYAGGGLKFLGLMVATILVDYIAGLLLEYYQNKGQCEKAKITLIIAVILNLGSLCFFKYIGFILENLNHLPGVEMTILKVTLPIGISFYTFQSMSYIVDVSVGYVRLSIT